MEELNALYCRLLHVGFIVLRQAICSGDNEWIRAEIDFLHNMPSLIGESNVERHRYFWFIERGLYIERVSAAGGGQRKSRMRTYYEPIWLEMEPVMLRMLGQSPETDKSALLHEEAALKG